MSEEKKSFEPLPEGDYLVAMNYLEERETKKGGKMLKASFQVQEGDHKNRLIFETFMTEGSSDKAIEISMDRLNKYLKAIGINGGLEAIGNDLSKLNNFKNSPFIASVKVKQDSPYVNRDGIEVVPKPSNGIKSFKAR